jgi:uncharacterized protein YcfJ
MNKLILSTLMATMLTSTTTWAKQPNREPVIWAKVTHVEPITRIISQRAPQRECWNEPVRYRERGNYRTDPSGAIIGTIIGGAIGNNVSRNRGAGTVIGAVIGASVGSSLSREGYAQRDRVYYKNERRCQVTESVNYQQTTTGYNVWYKYQGNEYQTKMDHHPGKKIRIRMSVEPY